MIPPTRAWPRPQALRHTSAPHHQPPSTITQHLRCRAPTTTKRYNASRPPGPVGQKAPSSAATIPGPSWLWLEPIYEPFRAYGRVQRRRPYMTQFISSLVIYLVGDFVAQSIGPTAGAEEGVEEEEEGEKGWLQAWAVERDWARTGRALVIGGLAAVPGYRWFLWLGNSFNYGSKTLSLGVKVCYPFRRLAV